jgi:tRNA(adenine34) deaminase
MNHPQLNHKVEVVSGLLAEECGPMLSNFFLERRGKKPLTPHPTKEENAGGKDDDKEEGQRRLIQTPPIPRKASSRRVRRR